MKKGDKIRGLQMEDYNGADHQATQMNGRIYTVDYIDDSGQIHLQESGLAVIPNVDRFVLVDCATKFDKEMSDIYDVIDDYLKINDYIEDEDGIFLSKRGTTHLTTLRAIRSEGEFFPGHKGRLRLKLAFCFAPGTQTREDGEAPQQDRVERDVTTNEGTAGVYTKKEAVFSFFSCSR